MILFSINLTEVWRVALSLVDVETNAQFFLFKDILMCTSVLSCTPALLFMFDCILFLKPFYPNGA